MGREREGKEIGKGIRQPSCTQDVVKKAHLIDIDVGCAISKLPIAHEPVVRVSYIVIRAAPSGTRLGTHRVSCCSYQLASCLLPSLDSI